MKEKQINNLNRVYGISKIKDPEFIEKTTDTAGHQEIMCTNGQQLLTHVQFVKSRVVNLLHHLNLSHEQHIQQVSTFLYQVLQKNDWAKGPHKRPRGYCKWRQI